MSAATRFHQVKDLLNDQKCKDFISEKITEIENKRKKAFADAALHNLTLAQTPLEFLTDRNLLNPEAMIQEYFLITANISPLPAACKIFIWSVMVNSIQKTTAYYDKLDSEPTNA